MVVTLSYEGSDKEDKLKTVPVLINNNNVDKVSDSDTDSSKEDFKNDDENFFNEDIEAPTKPLSMQKWYKP